MSCSRRYSAAIERLRSPRGGFSLAEVLAYMAIFGMVLGAVYVVLVASARNYAIQMGMVDVEQSQVACTGRLSAELGESSPGSIRYDTAPVGLVFASPRDATGKVQVDPASLNVIWQSLVCYYLDTVGGVTTLCRKEWPITPSTTAPVISASNDSAWFQANTALQRHILGRNISSFTVTMSNPLQITITGTTSPLGSLDQMVVQTGTVLRN